MTKVKSSLATYSDVLSVWDTVVERGGNVKYQVRTHAEAVKFRQRCYQARIRRRELLVEEVGLVPGYAPELPYDGYELIIMDKNGERVKSGKEPEAKQQRSQPGPFFVLFVAGQKVQGKLLDEDGTEIPIAAPPKRPKQTDGIFDDEAPE